MVEWVGASHVRRLTSTGNFAGVAMTNGAALGDIVMVAPPGEIGVPIYPAVTVTVGQKLYRMSGSASYTASNVVNGDPIGVAMESGGAGGSLVNVATRA